MGNIFNMFGPSPIKPIEKHIKKVHACAEQLAPFFEAVLKGDWETAKYIQEHVQHLEHEADVMKRELRLHLPTGLFLPVSRTDLLELLNAQDAIANTAEDIVGLVTSRHMPIPKTIESRFTPFLARCLDASEQACQAINELDALLESGFRGNEVTIVEGMIVKLDEIEHDTDEQQALIRNALFEIENTLPPIEVMFLYTTFQWIGDLADHAQNVGSRLQILIAR